MATATIAPPPSLIRWHYGWYAAAALAVMLAAILSGDRWFLNFVHVLSGLLWTGIDIFMGFVVGPVLRQVDVSVRREIALRLTPRTLFLMPTLAIITGTTGWYLTVQLGFLGLPWPQFGWVTAALVLITILSIQGFAILTPTNVIVCLELQKSQPDMARISRLMRIYFVTTASQGIMQVVMIVIMARFVSGI
jgi:uncharacterized membrane protein